MTQPLTLTLLAFLSLTPVAAAQNLIALTRNTRSIHQGVHATCTPLGTCPTGLPIQTATVNYWPGGTAWDGTANALWVTTGKFLEQRTVAPCGLKCAQGPCPMSPFANEAMGMDFNDLTNQLWILDDVGVVTRCSNLCPPAALGSFPVTGLTANGTPTAVAIDEMHGVVFYASSNFATGSWIHCATLANPGGLFLTMPMTICNGALITGLAVHPGLGKLYVTNGRETYDLNFSYTAGPPPVVAFFGPSTCCVLAPPGDPYIDLSIRWAPAVPMGEPCANGTCPSCPMVHLLRNAPLLGTNLQLGLDFAPPGIPVWCLLNFGSCLPTGLSMPPLCGPLRVPTGGAPLAALPMVVTAGGPCNAQATSILALPPNPIYLGTPMASQYVGLCPPLSTTMSNCLSWVIQ